MDLGFASSTAVVTGGSKGTGSALAEVEIASATAYLASRRNGYATGATINVDGGSDFI
jgi:NAD(P)-dependent dehydrogenase (short-subunit alcohol dehydrogenase family)